MRILQSSGVPAWASGAFRSIENAVTALEQKVLGPYQLAPERLVLPLESSRSPVSGEIRYDTSSKQIKVWDASTKSWIGVELT